MVYPMKLTKRQTRYLVKNPVEQTFYATAETYSHRHFPRAKKCIPKTEVVFYFEDKNGSPVDPT